MTTILSEKSPPTELVGKYLTFRLGGETYGISVLKVREIIRQTNITNMPQMPDFIKGVINLRGKIIPVVDLRLKYAMSVGDTTEQSCIVVVQVDRKANVQLWMGIVVDAVEEVANIATADIEKTPDFGIPIDNAYILGMAKIKGVVKILLDIDRVLTAPNLETTPELECTEDSLPST